MRENLAPWQALMTVLLLAGVIVGALVYTAAMYVGAALVLIGAALVIYYMARGGRAAAAQPEPQRIPLRVEEPEKPSYRKAA